eukprot:scaffold169359_cov17-Tisochrysis_lutea.AAC.1
MKRTQSVGRCRWKHSGGSLTPFTCINEWSNKVQQAHKDAQTGGGTAISGAHRQRENPFATYPKQWAGGGKALASRNFLKHSMAYHWAIKTSSSIPVKSVMRLNLREAHQVLSHSTEH